MAQRQQCEQMLLEAAFDVFRLKHMLHEDYCFSGLALQAIVCMAPRS